MKNIYFRCDTSRIIGSGHVLRCLTIAEKLIDNGYKCFLITSKSFEQNFKINFFSSFEILTLPRYDFDPNYDQLRYENSHDYINFEKNDIKNILALRHRIYQNSIIVVDHYLLGKQWQNFAGTIFKKVVVIDDLLNTSHSCDLIIDPNIRNKIETDRIRKNFKNITLLTGKQFLIIRPSFKKARKRIINALSIKKETVDCLVLFGGSEDNETIYNIISCIIKIRHPIKIHIVLGKSNKNKTQIKKVAEENINVKLYSYTKNIEIIMEKCDFAIGALGTTTWERCYLGLPTLVFVKSYNQLRFLEDLVFENIVFDLGKTITTQKVLNGCDHFQIFSKNFSKTRINLMNKIDGEGITRITKEIIKLLS
mgnify:FL=1